MALAAVSNLAPILIAASTTGNQDGAGSSAGAATVTGVGSSLADAAGSSAGAATVAGVGASFADAVGTAAGSSTAAAVGLNAQDGDGSAAGSSTVTGVGNSLADGAGSAAGVATVTGVGVSFADAVGTASGSSTASAVSDAPEPEPEPSRNNFAGPAPKRSWYRYKGRSVCATPYELACLIHEEQAVSVRDQVQIKRTKRHRTVSREEWAHIMESVANLNVGMAQPIAQTTDYDDEDAIEALLMAL